ncbi:hypothetical protein EB796_020843 [Bugula neritina]|uniref:Uncharacterized protein n=1 Tax=Bugula neritina TaxID=10212 RepID=A0A7J7J427_BUGNE|nr:hypothetical protein EB796_020843 [Bugula neritina]
MTHIVTRNLDFRNSPLFYSSILTSLLIKLGLVILGNDESQKQGGLSTTPSNTDQGNEMSAPAVPVKRSRKSTESSDDQVQCLL